MNEFLTSKLKKINEERYKNIIISVKIIIFRTKLKHVVNRV